VGPDRIVDGMDLGFHIADFTWNGGSPELASTLGRLARDAEAGGIARLTVMDHFWQIAPVGAPEERMLEAYTTLGYLAAVTDRVLLHTLVTGVIYREPGFLAKVVSTLDVLSGGRAGLGIGAAWFAEEAEGLGFPFPPLGERFERLEETLQICLQMWGEDDAAFAGRHYQLKRTLNSPAPLSRPRPYVMIGGGGERKTLRLVAQYADGCNIFGGGEEARHKLDVLRSHCETVGRDYDEIEKTTMINIDASTSQGELLDKLRAGHDAGFTTAYVFARNPEPLAAIELLAGVSGEVGDW
jgi:F420-dependent oxidoreductase-like protein